jgi:predicted metalloendopeptidase
LQTTQVRIKVVFQTLINLGIRVAFRAYRNWASIHGSDKRLNGYLVNQMTDDQIFFTRYAQIWCSEQDFTEGFANNYDDTHSPRRGLLI